MNSARGIGLTVDILLTSSLDDIRLVSVNCLCDACTGA